MTTHPGHQPPPSREDNLIMFPGVAGAQVPAPGGELEPTPEVLEGELVGGPEFTRRAMPVVVPPWLRTRETAVATLRWAVRYAGRHVAFHSWRSPAYGLALVCWTLRGAARDRCRVRMGERAR